MTRYLFALLGFMMVVALPFSASAAVSMTINIDSQPPVSGTDCVTLSQTGGGGKQYGNLTIAGYGGNDARVGDLCAGTTDDDTVNDGMRLLTAVITSSDTGVEHTITFQGVYTDPPTAKASAGTQVWYKLSGQGNFKKSSGAAATGATVKAWGYIESPAGSGTWTQITGSYLSKTIGLLSSFFGGTILSQVFPPPDISGGRTLKCTFKFTFQNAGDQLLIDNTNGIVVYSSGSPGPGSDGSVFVPHPGSKKCPPDMTCLPIPEKGKKIKCPPGVACPHPPLLP